MLVRSINVAFTGNKELSIATTSFNSNKTPTSLRTFSSFRFSIGRLMAIMACIGALFVFGNSWYSFFIFQFVVAYAFGEILVANLPSKLRNEIQKNCIRLNGTWSDNRECVEARAIDKLRWDIRLVLLLVLVPTTFLIWFVDREVVPISIGFDSFAAYNTSPQDWKTDLGPLEREFDRWSTKTSASLNTGTHKRLLWRSWPLLAIGGLAWISGCCFLIKSSYLQQLKQLAADIEERRWGYTLGDRAHGDEFSDF